MPLSFARRQVVLGLVPAAGDPGAVLDLRFGLGLEQRVIGIAWGYQQRFARRRAGSGREHGEEGDDESRAGE